MAQHNPTQIESYAIDWFFRFESVPSFVFGGFAPQIGAKGGRWISHQAPCHAWYSGSHGQNHPLIDVQDGSRREETELARSGWNPIHNVIYIGFLGGDVYSYRLVGCGVGIGATIRPAIPSFPGL